MTKATQFLILVFVLGLTADLIAQTHPIERGAACRGYAGSNQMPAAAIQSGENLPVGAFLGKHVGLPCFSKEARCFPCLRRGGAGGQPAESERGKTGLDHNGENAAAPVLQGSQRLGAEEAGRCVCGLLIRKSSGLRTQGIAWMWRRLIG